MKENKTNRYNLITKSFLSVFSITALSISLGICFCHPKHSHSSFASTDTRGVYAAEQWAISKIDLNDAWDITIGSGEVKVGVVDSGIDGSHTDLLPNIDTYLSYSFSTAPGNGLDHISGHGTNVAGVIGADGFDSEGISGICWDIDLVSLRIEQAFGGADYDTFSDVCEYAANNHIPILNMSLGDRSNDEIFNTFSPIAMEEAMNDYPGLIVCAAGNFGINIDFPSNYVYPACFDLSNTIIVGNSDCNDSIASTSCFGEQMVDLFAPGVNIETTSEGGGYCITGGTSMSAPMVSGVAALLLSADSGLSAAGLKSAILGSVDEVAAMDGYCVTGGRLNALNALLSVVPEVVPGGSAVSSAIEAGGHKTYRMALGHGRYTVTVSGLADGYASLYAKAADGSLVEADFSGQGPHSFQFLCTQPKTVYFRIGNDASTSASVSVSAANHSHSYDHHKFFHSPLYHKSYCECYDYVLEPHLFQVAEHGEPAYCVGCGAPMPSLLPSAGGPARGPYLLDEEGVASYLAGTFNGGIYPVYEEETIHE